MSRIISVRSIYETSKTISFVIVGSGLIGCVLFVMPVFLGIKLDLIEYLRSIPIAVYVSDQLTAWQSGDVFLCERAAVIKVNCASKLNEEAMNIISDAITKYPGDPGLHLARARISLSNCYKERARIDLRIALNLVQGNAQPYMNRPSPSADTILEMMRALEQQGSEGTE